MDDRQLTYPLEDSRIGLLLSAYKDDFRRATSEAYKERKERLGSLLPNRGVGGLFYCPICLSYYLYPEVERGDTHVCPHCSSIHSAQTRIEVSLPDFASWAREPLFHPTPLALFIPYMTGKELPALLEPEKRAPDPFRLRRRQRPAQKLLGTLEKFSDKYHRGIGRGVSSDLVTSMEAAISVYNLRMWGNYRSSRRGGTKNSARLHAYICFSCSAMSVVNQSLAKMFDQAHGSGFARSGRAGPGADMFCCPFCGHVTRMYEDYISEAIGFKLSSYNYEIRRLIYDFGILKMLRKLDIPFYNPYVIF